MSLDKKILYLEGRPQAHILHRRFALSVAEKIEYIDPLIQWQDQNNFFLFNVYAWFRNAHYLAKNYSDYNVILVDNLHFTPVIMNTFFRRHPAKLIVHLGSHTLFFILQKKFNRVNLWLHKYFLKRYDALICEGEMSANMVQEILKEKSPKSYTTYLGIPAERQLTLNLITPDLNSFNILIIANGPTHFRAYYKGLDLMLKAFSIALKKEPRLVLNILGAWNNEVIAYAMSGIDKAVGAQINFLGNVANIEEYLRSSSLCLHCTRGDAFPTSTLESLAAGIPTLISRWTGTKEVVEKVDKRLVADLKIKQISKKIIWYFNLKLTEKKSLSRRAKTISENYTEEKAVINYKVTFEGILKDLK